LKDFRTIAFDMRFEGWHTVNPPPVPAAVLPVGHDPELIATAPFWSERYARFAAKGRQLTFEVMLE
jgi:hypothetical protein